MRLPRIQFSLLGLLAAMAVFGAALACIVKFGLSLPMVTIIWGLLLIVLMVTPVLALAGKLERRAFHAGFSWFGWMYILIYVFGFVTPPNSLLSSTSPICFPQIMIERGIFVIYKWVVPPGSRMLSSEDPEAQYNNLAANYDSRIWVPPVNPALPTGAGGGLGFPAGGGGIFGGAVPAPMAPAAPLHAYRYVPWEIFRDIAHALLTALWAALGGGLALFVARRNARRLRTMATPAPR